MSDMLNGSQGWSCSELFCEDSVDADDSLVSIKDASNSLMLRGNSGLFCVNDLSFAEGGMKEFKCKNKKKPDHLVASLGVLFPRTREQTTTLRHFISKVYSHTS